MALHLIRGINRGDGSSRGSNRSQGNIFNVDIEYIWVLVVALHLIEALIELQVNQEVDTYLRVPHLIRI